MSRSILISCALRKASASLREAGDDEPVFLHEEAFGGGVARDRARPLRAGQLAHARLSQRTLDARRGEDAGVGPRIAAVVDEAVRDARGRISRSPSA